MNGHDDDHDDYALDYNPFREDDVLRVFLSLLGLYPLLGV
jgi:hypothetical protein